MKHGSLTVKIKEAKKQYPIKINQDEIETSWKKEIIKPKNQYLVISDDFVWKLYQGNFPTDDKDVQVYTFPNGEEYKTLSTVEGAYKKLYEMKADRNTKIIALGGGVVGDTAGFVAASFLRGIPFIQIPTTLLAQIDSSIGGKVGVNYGAKNLIGFFYQPEIVYIDSYFWNTLDERQWLNGLGEMIKYAFLIDRDFFFGVYDNKISLKKRSPFVLQKLVKTSLMFKQRIIEMDEKENNIRRVLNLGHTLGHAIETAGEYKKYLHGEAVLLGLKAVLRISKQRQYLSNEEYELGISLINDYLSFGLSDNISNEQLLELLKSDKKRIGKKNVWILIKAIGEPMIADDVKEKEILDAIDFIRE